MRRAGLLAVVLAVTSIGNALARGVTPYLPLNLEPEIESEVERVLVLGDKPVMTRPIPAAVVLEALPKACHADAVLCERVQRYLKRYMHGTGLEFASAFTFSKFCPPVVADGKLLVPTYEGRVDVYALATTPRGVRPTNAQRLRRRRVG